jgi:hypothetical protein
MPVYTVPLKVLGFSNALLPQRTEFTAETGIHGFMKRVTRVRAVPQPDNAPASGRPPHVISTYPTIEPRP